MTPILCDYCDEPASMFFPRRGPSDRSFACDEHVPRAQAAVGARPDTGRVDTVLAGRPRFDELDLASMLERWRIHRAGRASVV